MPPSPAYLRMVTCTALLPVFLLRGRPTPHPRGAMVGDGRGASAGAARRAGASCRELFDGDAHALRLLGGHRCYWPISGAPGMRAVRAPGVGSPSFLRAGVVRHDLRPR